MTSRRMKSNSDSDSENNMSSCNLFSNLTDEERACMSNFNCDGNRLKRSGNLSLLKQITCDIFGLEGYWSSPVIQLRNLPALLLT